MGLEATATPTTAEGRRSAGAPTGPVRAALGRVDRHWLGAGALVAVAAFVYALYAYLRFRQGSFFGWDLGIFDQTVRSYAHLHLPHVTTMRHDAPNDPGKLEWTDHFSPILAVLAPLYWISASAYNLLLAQAVLLAAAALPVFAFARRRIGVPAAYLVVAVYLLYWPLQSALAFDFHEAAFAPPLIALLIERADARRWRQAAVWAALLLLVKEDMGLVVAMVGVWTVIRAGRGERCDRRLRRVGACFIAAGLGAMVLIIEVVMPVAGGSSMRNWQYDNLGATPGKAATRLLTHPSLFASGLIDPHVKVTTALWLMLPVLFVCLRSWLILLAVPLLVERYFADDPFYWVRDYHYNAFLATIIVLAAVDGIGKFRRPRVRLPWAVAALAVSVAILPRFPLWTLTGNRIWDAGTVVGVQRHLLARVPAGDTVLVPWATDPYVGGGPRAINVPYTEVAPAWILTADLRADYGALIASLPASARDVHYVPCARDGIWLLAKAAPGYRPAP